MRYRMKFLKTGSMKYVGHLDTLRYFQKVFRRADLPIRLTEGFHPHQILSFALPLGIGMTSEGDYVDFELTDDSRLSCEEIQRRLNQSLGCSEFFVRSVCLLPEDAKNAMSSVEAASYLIFFKEQIPSCMAGMTEEELSREAKAFASQENIPVVKETKKSVRIMDLASLIHRFEAGSFGETFDRKYPLFDREIDEFSLKNGDPYFYAMISAGSCDHLKPELLMQAFFSFLMKEQPKSGEEGPAPIQDPLTDSMDDSVKADQLFRIGVHRLDLFQLQGGQLVPLSFFKDKENED